MSVHAHACWLWLALGPGDPLGLGREGSLLPAHLKTQEGGWVELSTSEQSAG